MKSSLFHCLFEVPGGTYEWRNLTIVGMWSDPEKKPRLEIQIGKLSA